MERRREKEPSSMAWYRVVSIGRHAAWGSLRSGFVTPQSAVWWMGIVAIGSSSYVLCADHTFTHTYRCTQEGQQRERRKNWLELVVDAARHKWCPPPSFLFLLAVLFTSRCTLRGYTHRRQIYIFIYIASFIYKYVYKRVEGQQRNTVDEPQSSTASFSLFLFLLIIFLISLLLLVARASL